jgi:hypothetical protein
MPPYFSQKLQLQLQQNLDKSQPHPLQRCYCFSFPQKVSFIIDTIFQSLFKTLYAGREKLFVEMSKLLIHIVFKLVGMSSTEFGSRRL